jgi:lipid II:glycine glycyltransferase (peptidoglycan interpeptide bridge formation enzyme)
VDFSIKSNALRLADGYSSEVDDVEEQKWCEVLDRFDDANIYQTWSYDETRSGRRNISHLLLKRENQVVAAAQSRIVKVPLIGAGVAYVRWGPLWQGQETDPDNETFRQAIRALRNEYVFNRRLVLRLYPALFHAESSSVEALLREEGFSTNNQEPDRTLLLDLSRSLEDLRRGLSPHWQRELKVAEKKNLVIIEGFDDKLFDTFITIYKEMVARKAFIEPNDINEFRLIQNRLPERFKMKVMLCKSSDEFTSGAIFSTIGKTPIYLFGATSNVGIKSRGSYLLQWKFIEWLKSNGFTTYDLNGINPIANPGTYGFKSELCGSNGRDVRFLGRFDSCNSLISSSCVALGEGLRSRIQRQRKATSRLQKQPTRSPSAVLTPRTE